MCTNCVLFTLHVISLNLCTHKATLQVYDPVMFVLCLVIQQKCNMHKYALSH